MVVIGRLFSSLASIFAKRGRWRSARPSLGRSLRRRGPVVDDGGPLRRRLRAATSPASAQERLAREEKWVGFLASYRRRFFFTTTGGSVTITFATICGCSEQKYSYVPGVVKT